MANRRWNIKMKAIKNSTHTDDRFLESASKVIGRCDDCAKIIKSNDHYLQFSDSLFCEEHVCMLSEFVEELRISVEQEYLMELYSSLDVQKEAFGVLCRELETSGDRNFFTPK